MNWQIIVRGFDDGRPLGDHTVFQIGRPANLIRIADLGMQLEEGKAILGSIQGVIVAAQAESHSRLSRTCPSCGAAHRVKDYRQRLIDTVFGRVSLRLKRTTSGCGHSRASTGLARIRSTPEFDALRARLASELPYSKARKFLSMTLPVSAGLAPGTIRAHTFLAAKRLERQGTFGASNGRGTRALTLGVDTGFIRACSTENGRHIPVTVGEVGSLERAPRMFAATQHHEDSLVETIRANLHAQGLATNTEVTVLTDGDDGLRLLARRALRVAVAPVLDWFHIAMRIQHIRQSSGGSTTLLPSHAFATRAVCRELDLMRWRLWNGRVAARTCYCKLGALF